MVLNLDFDWNLSVHRGGKKHRVRVGHHIGDRLRQDKL